MSNLDRRAVSDASLAAAAVAPATAVLVAKTGFDIYKMFRGGGAGVAELLIAQTEMLRALSAQIAVVNEGIQLLIAGVEGLKDLVRELPSEAVRAIATSDLRASFTNIAEKLDRVAMLRERYGQAYALSAVSIDAALNLATLEMRRAVLMGDPSPVVIPMVCTCWYVEFQALATLVPFERERILSIARSYLRWLDRTEPVARKLVDDIEHRAGVVLAAQRKVEAVPPVASCYTDKRTETSVGWVDQFGYPMVKLTATHHHIAYSEAKDEDPTYGPEFDRLKSAQIAVHKDLRALRKLTWRMSSEPKSAVTSLMGPRPFPDYAQLLREVDAAPCPEHYFVADRTAGIFQAEAYLTMQAVTYYHFALACREARRSVAAVVDRLRQ